LAWRELRAPIRRVCGLDIPVPYAAPLEAAWLPSAEDIASVVRDTMGSTAPPKPA
jgi:pyruvate/2-oxoglutarate/acetoin dehydrogenase E1 component